jgi:hypothetical protein
LGQGGGEGDAERGGLVVAQGQLELLMPLVLGMNACTATMDVSVDGLALDVLDGEVELGWGNVAQTVGYKMGMIVGGGVLLQLVRIQDSAPNPHPIIRYHCSGLRSARGGWGGGGGRFLCCCVCRPPGWTRSGKASSC